MRKSNLFHKDIANQKQKQKTKTKKTKEKW